MRSDSLAERFPPGIHSALVAVLAGLAGVLGSYGAAGFTPTFVVAPVASFLSKRMPGPLITFAITVLGDIGQKLNLLTAATLVVGVFAALAWLWMRIGRAYGVRALATFGTAGSAWVVTAVLTGRPVPALGAALGAGVVVAVADLSLSVEQFVGVGETDGRRRVLAALVAAVAAVIVGYQRGEQRPVPTEVATSAPSGEVHEDVSLPEFDVSDRLQMAGERSFEFGEMDPLVSEDFYEVDINSVNPAVDAAEWSLSITGAVEQELEFSFADVVDREYEHRFVTLRCVGESLNGHKMDTALWTGIPVGPLLERAGPQSGCDCVMLRAADGYYEQFPLEALEPGLLAFGMNGKPLPRGHGAPLRALVPGHWGEVNVKWLTEIELLADEQKGYWEKKGWHGTGPVKTVAKLHAKTKLDDGRIRVGGHTYAGTRGIQTVEVSTDGGTSWTEAELTEPLPGDDVWRQWRYTYDPPDAIHEVVVRATDGTGTVQPREREDPFPSGPEGWVRQEINPTQVQ